MVDDGEGSKKKLSGMLGVAASVIAVLGFVGVTSIGDLFPSRTAPPVSSGPVSSGPASREAAAVTPGSSQQRPPATAQPAPAAAGSAEVVGDWSGFGGSGPGDDSSLALTMTLSADGRYAMTLNFALNEEGTYGAEGGTLYFRPRQAAPHAWSYALRATPTGRALILSNDAFEFALYRA